MFGIDVHPVYQLLLRFKKVKQEGYDLVFLKVSEGTRYIPKGLRLFAWRIKKQNFRFVGYYHFLTSADPVKQAANFEKRVRKLGGPKGKVLIVDFEEYINNPGKTPGNMHLKRFVASVKKRFPGKKVLLYSGPGFWNGGDPSGDASQYGVDGIWSAHYGDMNKHGNPKGYWKSISKWWQRTSWFGGNPPPKRVMGQFTSTGKVAGMYVDVNYVFNVDELERIRG